MLPSINTPSSLLARINKELNLILIMLYSRFTFLTIPSLLLLAAIFYFRDSLLQSYNLKLSEYNTVPTNSSINFMHNLTTIDPSLTPSEPRIVQVSMLFGEQDDETFQRCLDTHFEYGKRWGHETYVLREAIRTHQYFLLNKSLYVLSYLLTEMAKKPDERAVWIV